MKRSVPAKSKSPAEGEAADASSAINLEEALKELEGIVHLLEDPATPLEASIAHYSRGMELSRLCAQRLAGLERQILVLQRGVDGQPDITELTAEETFGGNQTV